VKVDQRQVVKTRRPSCTLDLWIHC